MPDGSISKVELLIDGVELAEDTVTALRFHLDQSTFWHPQPDRESNG